MREPTTDPPREWARGDVCKLTFAGQSVKASVMMAGKRGCSLMLIFSGSAGRLRGRNGRALVLPGSRVSRPDHLADRHNRTPGEP